MKRRSVLALSVMVACGVQGVYAAIPVAPPALYAPQTWQGRTKAVLRVLNRLDAHVETLTVPVGAPTAYRSLSIVVDSCVSRPPTLPEDAGVLLHLRDSGDATRPPFDGWMMANEPGLAVYGSPLYDVRVVSCAGDNTAPNPGPLPVVQKPVLPGSVAPDTVGDGTDAGNGPVPLAPGVGAPIPLAPPSNAPLSLMPPSSPSAPSQAAPQHKTAPSDLAPPEATDPGLE